MRRRSTCPATDPTGHVATLGRLCDLQRAIASRGQPTQATSPVPLRHGVGRVLARPLLRTQGGGVLIEAGTPLAALHMPLIAQEGVGVIQVHDKVRVGILALEDRDCAAAPRPRQVASAVVAALLRSAVEQLGAKAVDESSPSDCGHAIAHAVESLRAQCDLVLVIGFIPPAQLARVAAALDARGLAWTAQELRARPLGALQLAHCGSMPIVALSPDLATAFSSFVAFVSPLIRRIQGRHQWLPDVEFGQLEGPMPHRNAWGFFCVTAASGDALASNRLQHCKRRDSAATIAQASGLAWRPLDLGLHRDANVAFYPFHRWLQ
jgi:molybdopterin molybdotransferase